MRQDDELDRLLHRSLRAGQAPDSRLVRQLKDQIRDKEFAMKLKVNTMLRTAVMAAVLLALLCTTALAAWVLLRPAQVSEHVGDHTLSEAFTGDGAVDINATAASGDYVFTLMSVVTGENISDFLRTGANVQPERTYAVMAIQRADGAPMPDYMDDAYLELDFFVTPLVKGEKPWQVNIASMNGNYSEFVEDGVLYRLLECDTVAIFADRGLYIGVCSGFIPGPDTFLMDQETGEIAANPDYPGISVVFDLPLDPALADPVRAEEHLDAICNPEFITIPSPP